MESRIKGKKA
jgi:hypothetical protein